MVYDEENNAYYLIVRYDIEERMTEDDIWTDDQKKAAVSAMFSDAFQEKLDGWVEAQNLEVIKRYDPFKIDFTGEE